MCTCIDLKTKDHYFGRTLDLEYSFGEKVVITPRNYLFKLKNKNEIRTKYALIGMATVTKDYPLYAEASNEKGLSMAGLNFPGTCCLSKPKEDKLNLAQFELIPYFLGLYSKVSEIKEDISKLNITNIPFIENGPIGELHYMICDENECIVLEQTKTGIHIYDNPVRVMTNNPTFDYHLYNINNYLNLSPHFPENKFSKKLNLKPYGEGMGLVGLPGDVSPSSRFIRAAFNRANSICNEDLESSVSQFFHILDSVSMVRGSTITKDGNYDITRYLSCINTTQGIFFYKTYDNSQITAVKMTDVEKNKNSLTIFELITKEQIKYEN